MDITRALVLLVLATASGIHAVKFDLAALPPPAGFSRCVSQYIGKDVLVSGTIDVGDGPHQRVDVEITDASPEYNKYFAKKDASGSLKFAFTTHSYADVDFCVTNTLATGVSPSPTTKRSINIHINSGADAADYTEMARQEKLRPIEIELRRLEVDMDDIVKEMEYLKDREAKMRDTNESTNERVKYFSLLSIGTLISVGVWQIWHLRKFFSAKKLI
ncbi:hypothetical protein SeMB42_g05273 [Synchytrium endobioticum]|uniref:GOLD domain-containing protein n=1 Tax=Synchytrium endobioticum TaxID=286115 RepID=A0A507CRY6_9FUNG|nr:hypothetical protein SeLEV6574_g05909 [Synchytrium endobioticum]TPX42125.1 hypothetical protein SeMB42_g05273 [Synchytrium endobioticum]